MTKLLIMRVVENLALTTKSKPNTKTLQCIWQARIRELEQQIEEDRK